MYKNRINAIIEHIYIFSVPQAKQRFLKVLPIFSANKGNTFDREKEGFL